MCQVPSPAATSPALTRAEREALLAVAEKPLLAAVRKLVFPCQFEDAMQDVRLLVWEGLDKFDPTRGAKWTTYAVGIAKRHCQKIRAVGSTDPIQDAQFSSPADNIEFLKEQSADVASPEDSAAEQEQDPVRDDDAAGAEAVRAVRAVAAGPLLAVLSSEARAIVAPIVLDGLTPSQVADQVGRSVKDAKLIIRNAAKAVGIRFPEAAGRLAAVPKVSGPPLVRRPKGERRAFVRSAVPSKRVELEPLAIAALADVGPNIRAVAAKVGVSAESLSCWPNFRAAYDRLKGERDAAGPPRKLVVDGDRSHATRRKPAAPVRRERRPSRAEQLEPLALGLLAEVGPNMERIAVRLECSDMTLRKCPAFMAAYKEARAAGAPAGYAQQPKRAGMEARAVALLAEVGPNIQKIAERLGVNRRSLPKWPAFRAAFDAAKAGGVVLAATPPVPAAVVSPEPASGAKPGPTPSASRSGHGWHFGKRLVPSSANALLSGRGRKRAKR